jgi:hypothetical protein
MSNEEGIRRSEIRLFFKIRTILFQKRLTKKKKKKVYSLCLCNAGWLGEPCDLLLLFSSQVPADGIAKHSGLFDRNIFFSPEGFHENSSKTRRPCDGIGCPGIRPGKL